MSRRSLIIGTCVLIGLFISLPFRRPLLGVALGLASGSIIAAWTPWFKGR